MTNSKTFDQTSVLSDILKVIYWSTFTTNQQTVIINVIKDPEISDNVIKANEICEFLSIEKRHNRSAIARVLDQL